MMLELKELEMPELILNKDLPAIVGVSLMTIYTLRANGEFIEPVRLSKRRIAWRRNEVEAWLAAR